MDPRIQAMQVDPGLQQAIIEATGVPKIGTAVFPLADKWYYVRNNVVDQTGRNGTFAYVGANIGVSKDCPEQLKVPYQRLVELLHHLEENPDMSLPENVNGSAPPEQNLDPEPNSGLDTGQAALAQAQPHAQPEGFKWAESPKRRLKVIKGMDDPKHKTTLQNRLLVENVSAVKIALKQQLAKIEKAGA